jgi:hypothetical protein
MRKILVFAALATLCFAAASWAAKNQDPIPQGDFAAVLASHLNTPAPPGGWTSPEAVTFLTSKGIVPETGSWQAGGTLNERTMTHVLRLVGLSIYSPQPDAVVTYEKAYAVFNRYDDFFRNYNLANLTTTGETTTHISGGLAGTDSVAPASGNTPR